LQLRPWPPTRFLRLEKVLGTSMRTAIVQTDAGRAYLKAMGNPEGEHALACELIGTRLAAWFGLPTLDHHVLILEDADVFELPGGGEIRPGPAFITRGVTAIEWSGERRALGRLHNPDDIAALVVLDTWLLNCDRYPRVPRVDPPPHPAAGWRRPNRGNVLLEWEGTDRRRPRRLLAMDFTHAFTAGHELSPRVAHIESIQDSGIYGCFPEFRPFLTEEAVRSATMRLRDVSSALVGPIVEAIPGAWQVGPDAREALVGLLCERARWLVDTLPDLLLPYGTFRNHPGQQDLPWDEGGQR
jgi:hypothetical protein